MFEQTGTPISGLQRRHRFQGQRYSFRLIILDPGPSLRQRIDERVDKMVADGWLTEVQGLLARGLVSSHPMKSLGYRHLAQHLQGVLDFQEAVRQTKRDTWRFARRQRNWFRQQPEAEHVSDPAMVLTTLSEEGQLARRGT